MIIHLGTQAAGQVQNPGGGEALGTCSLHGVLFLRRPLCVDFAADVIEGEQQVMLLMKVDRKLDFDLRNRRREAEFSHDFIF